MGGTISDLPPRIVTLYFALRTGGAVAGIALTVVNAYLLFFRVRLGDEGAALACVLANTLSAVGAGLVAYHVHIATGAHTPWQGTAAAFVVLMLAYFLWLPPKKPR